MTTVIKKKIPLLMAIAAVIIAVGAILILALAVPNSDAQYKKVLGSVIAVLMLVLSAMIGYYLWLQRDVEPNFFLFDRAKKRNISVDDLTFKIVNERMSFFLTLHCDSVEQLWSENALENDSKLGYRRVFRPLLAYKMLYDLADKNLDSYWNCLFEASPDVIDSLCNALEQGGEQELVKAFRFLMEHYKEEPHKIKDFVTGNTKYIRGRMLSYIKHHIEAFY